MGGGGRSGRNSSVGGNQVGTIKLNCMTIVGIAKKGRTVSITETVRISFGNIC